MLPTLGDVTCCLATGESGGNPVLRESSPCPQRCHEREKSMEAAVTTFEFAGDAAHDGGRLQLQCLRLKCSQAASARAAGEKSPKKKPPAAARPNTPAVCGRRRSARLYYLWCERPSVISEMFNFAFTGFQRRPAQAVAASCVSYRQQLAIIIKE